MMEAILGFCIPIVALVTVAITRWFYKKKDQEMVESAKKGLRENSDPIEESYPKPPPVPKLRDDLEAELFKELEGEAEEYKDATFRSRVQLDLGKRYLERAREPGEPSKEPFRAKPATSKKSP